MTIILRPGEFMSWCQAVSGGGVLQGEISTWESFGYVTPFYRRCQKQCQTMTIFCSSNTMVCLYMGVCLWDDASSSCILPEVCKG